MTTSQGRTDPLKGADHGRPLHCRGTGTNYTRRWALLQGLCGRRNRLGPVGAPHNERPLWGRSMLIAGTDGSTAPTMEPLYCGPWVIKEPPRSRLLCRATGSVKLSYRHPSMADVWSFHLDYSLTVTLTKSAVVCLEPSSKYRFKCFIFGLNISLGSIGKKGKRI